MWQWLIGRRWGGAVRRAYEALGLRHLVPLLILILYSLAGAAVFFAVEAPIGGADPLVVCGLGCGFA